MSIYPGNVQQRFASPRRSGRVAGENAVGKYASFACGTFVRFSLRINTDTKTVSGAAFETNGCGFMIAAADVLTEFIAACKLSELNGLNESELCQVILDDLGPVEDDRQRCIQSCVSAVQDAFADYRNRQAEEFRGERALVCTCFGVTEETIENYIATKSPTSVDDVTRDARAGGGCGSCRMLIQEMLDGFAMGS